ncbi:MAG: hypothetical protein OEY52_14330 [Gammaproteobacteria bacterium]|nr:hypothetical protein [Gammaproteobacteria bacterium]
MRQVTLKQILSLLLMTAAMALILTFMPEQQNAAEQIETGTSLIKQAAK